MREPFVTLRDRLYRELAASDPALVRGLVRCQTCGREQRVDSAQCLAHGWPTCHGETMRLVSEKAGGAGA